MSDEEFKGIIAVLTSGGDSQGMNAATVQVVKTARKQGYKVIGFKGGYRGVYYDDWVWLDENTVSTWIGQGGTNIYSDRFEDMILEDDWPEEKKTAPLKCHKKCVENLRKHEVKGLIAIGGDGTFKGATRLAEADKNLPVIAIPGSIDNDLNASDYTIGFDTATGIAVKAIEELRDTMESHARCDIVEVMGRGCGDIAVFAAVAAGADAVITRESFDVKEFQIKNEAGKVIGTDVQRQKETVKGLIEKCIRKKKVDEHKRSVIIVVAEGVFQNKMPKNDGTDDVKETTIIDCLDLAAEIAKTDHTDDKELSDCAGVVKGNIDIKGTVLGHVQRGGQPTAFDRILACKMADAAVKAIVIDQQSDMVVCYNKGRIVLRPIQKVACIQKGKRILDKAVYEVAPLLSYGENTIYQNDCEDVATYNF